MEDYSLTYQYLRNVIRLPKKTQIQFHESFSKKKAQQEAGAQSDQDRLGWIAANVSLAFCLPTLGLG
jgi:hypothetical protein